MRATRRRARKIDPTASPRAVRRVINQLQAALPDIIPQKDKDLVRLLRAVRHIQRYPATDTKRGRPGRWKREDLLKVAARLGNILERETSSHVSVASFIDHHLRLLHFPEDVLGALAAGDINLFEAEQLARITSGRLASTPGKTARMRVELLSSHLRTKASGERLRRRVNELLGTATDVVEAGVGVPDTAPVVEVLKDLEDFDPYDPTHLFWDQIKQLGFAFREICREDVSDQEIEELLEASEPIMAVLVKIQRRKGKTRVSKIRL